MSDTPTEPALSRDEWNSGADVFEGHVDILAGIIDVRLGGPGGTRDPDREARALIALLNQIAGPDGGPLFTHEMVDALARCVGPDYFPDYPDLADQAVAALRSLLPPREG